MECQSSDSKKLFKVFDASKRKRTRKKREGLDDTTSVVTDDSASVSILSLLTNVTEYGVFQQAGVDLWHRLRRRMSLLCDIFMDKWHGNIGL